MKITMKTQSLMDALDIVSIVPPKAFDPSGKKGFLFIIRDKQCYLYSEDQQRSARADFPVDEVEVGEGEDASNLQFIYPVNYVQALKKDFLGETLVVTALKTSDGNYVVRYAGASGAGAQHGTYAPGSYTALDADYNKATADRTFPVGLLRSGLEKAKVFMAKPNDYRIQEERFKTVKIFDASSGGETGNGCLFAADGVRAMFFTSEALRDKGLSAHGQHLPFIASFLGKCEGVVTIKQSEKSTYAVDSKGRVLGWTMHAKEHEKFAYYSLKYDQFVLVVAKGALLTALRHQQSEMDKRDDKVKLEYDRENKRLNVNFSGATDTAKAFPVPVNPLLLPEDRQLSVGVNLEYMIDLVSEAEVPEIELRISYIKKDDSRKEIAFIRTIETYYADGAGKVVAGSEKDKAEGTFKCTVTRFTPSKD